MNFAVYAKRMDHDLWEELEKAYDGYDREMDRFKGEHRQRFEDMGAWTGD